MHKQLIDWYLSNKRELPWRENNSPYSVWLSEIILQQTRVDQGKAYFERFIQHFPTVSELAAASEDEVLKLWQGLGYYSRARNLHKTAKLIAFSNNNSFPSSYTELLKLPGIGPYTAAAIASIAFHQKVAAIDGNVNRVISRLFDVNLAVDQKEGSEKIKSISNALIQNTKPGDFNQALMELGARICKPQNPLCLECPLHLFCEARKNKTQHLRPIKSTKVKVKSVYTYYIVVTDKKNQVWVKKRSQKGTWQNLFDFPEITIDKPSSNILNLVSSFTGEHLLNCSPTILNISPPITHLLSHRKIEATFIDVCLENGDLPNSHLFQILPISEFKQLAIPRLVHKFLEQYKTTWL